MKLQREFDLDEPPGQNRPSLRYVGEIGILSTEITSARGREPLQPLN